MSLSGSTPYQAATRPAYPHNRRSERKAVSNPSIENKEQAYPETRFAGAFPPEAFRESFSKKNHSFFTDGFMERRGGSTIGQEDVLTTATRP
ncbi:hypothetical protein A0U92_11335 [Acetobacter aceti]|uniref:Uncharacterized protein n=1 Tax=Acetobacter aceti TaxID=435 RepID=A0A1U9KHL2_ACEAC|nr:hypothetical protein A0U92_11335 [Acetobacter aceti]